MEIPDNLTWFRDRQQDPVCGFCKICGNELYNNYSNICFDCERKDEENIESLRD